ncbi:epimerase [Carbonactinospora thermoautotrophica]|uniref:Epimerase n=1 Tax=Carbonactinospora thermoautotrophica TaxID=1469144 RepID=A0A132NIZ6_9ACTN|nr:TIGR01777 family oxidoreductase [Carbonactinospora thermoautotrophica]KWX00233.1 epimerase [Carbonactinospora thermoautotrophica]KWX01732.1 hypothetical protein LI90_2764 [Carbonactinospora thermoautotrophica]KWX10121.1 epimerase [Carbonactinospora thermoautotrophica]
MRIAVTGSSGLIGSTLVPALRADGHEVIRLVRRAPQAADEVRWDPRKPDGGVDVAELAGVDAVITLAGAGVGDRRWTDAYKQEIRDSRVLGTATISAAIARLDPPPRVLLAGSAVGWYGDTGSTPVDENSPPGSGFLAEVCREWEAATRPAEEAGIRTVHLRTGIVLSRHGGFLKRQLPIFRLGLGGRLGHGRQYVSFISRADEVRAIRFLLTADDVRGPVNLTAPEPVTYAEFARALGEALHRPALLRVPARALRLALGEFAEEALGGQRALPRRLLDAGFVFAHPRVTDAIQAALAEDR